MKRFFYSTFITIYAVIAIFTTICLLSYNDYGVTEFGNYSLINITSNELNENFQKGDLILVNKKDKISNGDYIFIYNTYTKDMAVTLTKVTNIEEVNLSEKTYTLEGNYDVSSQYVIGPAMNCLKIALVGNFLTLLESKWGFLFLIVFPLLIAFIYEVMVVIGEIKNVNAKDKKRIKE